MVPLPLLAFLGLVTRVAAQTGKNTATCTYASWTSFKGNSPCQIWANLQAACDPNASVGTLNTAANKNAQYPPPSGSSATPCQCNVVAYNLMAGCSWCQPNVYSDNWVSEAQWKTGCSNYDATGLPSQALSVSSQIPPWALQVENGGSWFAFEASSIADAGTTPTATLSSNIFGGSTGTAFGTGTFGATGRFTTNTRFPAATVTGFRSGGDDFDPLSTIDLGKAVGIPVGIVLGCYVLLAGIVLAVFFTRQKNRKAWYGPTAKFYRDGGRMVESSQPLLSPNVYGGQQPPNPFTTPSPTSSPATMQSAPYDPNMNYSQAGQGYHQPQYYDPQAGQPGMYQTGPPPQQVIHV